VKASIVVPSFVVMAAAMFFLGIRWNQVYGQPARERPSNIVHYSGASGSIEIVKIGDTRCAVLITTHGAGSLDCGLDTPAVNASNWDGDSVGELRLAAEMGEVGRACVPGELCLTEVSP
jgi:hypothetical protein